MKQCEFPYFFPGGQNCSGNGVCSVMLDINSTSPFCVCEDGWYSKGDFALDKIDCDQHILSISIMFGLDGAFAAFAIIFLLVNMYLICAFELEKEYRHGFERIIFHLVAIISCSLDSCLAISKAVSRGKKVIGEDALTSFSYALGNIAFFVASIKAMLIYQKVLMTTAQNFMEDKTLKLANSNFLLKLLPFPLMLFLSPIVCVYAQKEHYILLGRLNMAYIGVCALIILAVLNSFIGSMVKFTKQQVELSDQFVATEGFESCQNKALWNLYWSLKFQQNVIRFFYVGPISLLIFLAFSSYSLRLFSYLTFVLLPFKSCFCLLVSYSFNASVRRARMKVKPYESDHCNKKDDGKKSEQSHVQTKKRQSEQSLTFD